MIRGFVEASNSRVFLGGTCNDSKWRDDLIPLLTIDYFNPVVDDWNDEAQEKEIAERQSCDFVLYCLTPKMTGVYSIAEVVDDSNKRPEKTILVVLTQDGDQKFDDHQMKSLDMVGKMVETNGGQWFQTIEDAADYLNSGGPK